MSVELGKEKENSHAVVLATAAAVEVVVISRTNLYIHVGDSPRVCTELEAKRH